MSTHGRLVASSWSSWDCYDSSSTMSWLRVDYTHCCVPIMSFFLSCALAQNLMPGKPRTPPVQWPDGASVGEHFSCCSCAVVAFRVWIALPLVTFLSGRHRAGSDRRREGFSQNGSRSSRDAHKTFWERLLWSGQGTTLCTSEC